MINFQGYLDYLGNKNTCVLVLFENNIHIFLL